jgi:Superinfection immunity protein
MTALEQTDVRQAVNRFNFWIFLLAIVTGLQFVFFLAASFNGAGRSDPTAMILLSAVLSSGPLLYFTPGVVAWFRGHHQTMAITILTLFTGWTLIGWVAALVWACTRPQPTL